MTKLRSKFRKFVPKGLQPFLKRQIRQIDRLRGLPKSNQRPGVVLMLHVGRCGSTVLANLLGQNDNVYWDGKLPRMAKQLYGHGIKSLDHGPWIQKQFAISGDRFYGFEFKILDDQYPSIFNTTTAEFLEECRKIGVTHFILLARRNTLRHVVSHYASKNRGSWHSTGGQAVAKKEFTLDVNAITTGQAAGRPLVRYLEEVDAAHGQVRDLLAGEKFLEIEYEADIDEAGADSAYRSICTFLNIPAGDVQIRNRKMNPYPLQSVLENYDEVAQTLEGTDYSWMSKS